jgi:FtsP/CotA-like multicopper oxidase with cupredoxin domain
MALPVLAALFLASAPLQESVVPARPRVPLPRPVSGAAIAQVNSHRQSAGRLDGRTLTVSLDIVESAFQPEGDHDPVVRALAFAEEGKAPQIPGPLLRAPVGTTVRLTLRNRSDSAIKLGGLRPGMPPDRDTVHVAPGATREVTFTLDKVGNYFYWGALKGLQHFAFREWLDSQLTGAIVVDAPGARIPANERVILITEWFQDVPQNREFESALVFNGKAWPYNERETFTQGDSVHFRIINAAAIEHPLHLHGFYFRVTRHGAYGTDSVVPRRLQPLQNMRWLPIGASMSLSFVPTTPGNWTFHCHFAGHINELASLHGSPDAHVVARAGPGSAIPSHDAPGGHTMRGLVIGMHITPKPDYKEPLAANRRTLTLLLQKKENGLVGGQTAYGFLLQRDTVVPKRDALTIPGPVLELKRGEPVRIVVKNNLGEESGVHWHGLEIESYPDGVPGFSGIGDKIMPPIAPGDSFVAEFTPPRNGTFPYHSHLHEMRQIGSGMYGAIVVSDAPRDTTRDHVIVAGGGGLPVFYKQTPHFLLVNGRRTPGPIQMTAGVPQRLRLVSIHADFALTFRFGTEDSVVKWTPLARDGADLPPALRIARQGRVHMGPGETADFTFTPARPGALQLEVWSDGGQRVVLPVEVKAAAPATRPAR